MLIIKRWGFFVLFRFFLVCHLTLSGRNEREIKKKTREGKLPEHYIYHLALGLHGHYSELFGGLLFYTRDLGHGMIGLHNRASEKTASLRAPHFEDVGLC